MVTPYNSRYRKVIPKSFCDERSLIKRINFEILKGFYEDRVLRGHTDWENSGQGNKEFLAWITEAYHYITMDRPKTFQLINQYYEKLEATNPNWWLSPVNSKEVLLQIEASEKELREKDRKVLIEMMMQREYFWD
jgi:hypothetical protein